MTSPLRITVAKRTPATAAQLAEMGQRMFHDTYAAQNRPEDMAAYEAATFGRRGELVCQHDIELQGAECSGEFAGAAAARAALGCIASG